MSLSPANYSAWRCTECNTMAVLLETTEAAPIRMGGLGAECSCGLTAIRLRHDGLRDVVTPYEGHKVPERLEP